jgi:hypothetical protein
VKNLSATCIKSGSFTETSSEFRNSRPNFTFNDPPGTLTVTANLKDDPNVPFAINITSTDRWKNTNSKTYYFNNNFDCPTGFVGVPARNVNGSSINDFCVSQYQMTYQSAGLYHESNTRSSQNTCGDNDIPYSSQDFFNGSWGNLFNAWPRNFGTTSTEPPLRIKVETGEFTSGVLTTGSFFNGDYRCGQTYNVIPATDSRCTSYPSSANRTILFSPSINVNFGFCTQRTQAIAADFVCKGYGDQLNFGTSTYSNFALLRDVEWNNISTLAGNAAGQTDRDLQNGQTIHGFNGALAPTPSPQWAGAAQREITYGTNGANAIKGTTSSPYYGIRCTYRP